MYSGWDIKSVAQPTCLMGPEIGDTLQDLDLQIRGKIGPVIERKNPSSPTNFHGVRVKLNVHQHTNPSLEHTSLISRPGE